MVIQFWRSHRLKSCAVFSIFLRMLLNFQDRTKYRVQHSLLYRMSQELRSLFRDLIPELILSQKCHIHMDPIRNGSGVMSF